MVGSIRKRQLLQELAEQEAAAQAVVTPTCPICLREIPDSEKEAHHLVPKSKGGRETQYLHRICHQQIHALFKETELARRFNTAEALREDASMQTFIAWVEKKPNDFYQRSEKSGKMRGKYG